MDAAPAYICLLREGHVKGRLCCTASLLGHECLEGAAEAGERALAGGAACGAVDLGAPAAVRVVLGRAVALGGLVPQLRPRVDAVLLPPGVVLLARARRR